MRFRQVHLDFHTNATIPGIGSRFDAKAFGKAFKDAYVDSVTVFSKCHHGVSYHPTEVGKMHPHLTFDLLRAQIDALHAVGINAPVYLTATWDELAAFEHPEWRTVSPDGSLPMFRPEAGNGVGWAFLDFSTPYLDYLVAQTEEVMVNYPDADGIFMDISFQLPSISSSARTKMEALGLDWTDARDRDIFTAQSVENYFTRIRDAVQKHNPKMPLFFNSGHMRRGLRKHYSDYYTHLELESLPTAGWGYEHFPLSARYVDALGIPFLGMTGKFHTHWGEVGGYKKPEALVYEVGAMLAHGARCSIGDHLHPTGRIDQSTMGVIAPAYKWVAEREAWAVDTTNRAEVALLSVEAASRPSLSGVPATPRRAGRGRGACSARGQVRLRRGRSRQRLFAVSVADPARRNRGGRQPQGQGGEVRRRRAARCCSPARAASIPRAASSSTSAPNGTAPRDNRGGDYVLPVASLRADFVNDPLFMYQPAEKIRLTDGTSLGEVYEPYFDRTPRHFSGHINTPSKPDASAFAAGSSKGSFTYFAFPIFSCYHQVGSVAMLEIAEKLIANSLGGKRLVTTSLAARRPRHGSRPGGPEARRRAPAARHPGPARHDARRSGPADPGPHHAQQRRGHRRDHRQRQGRAARPVGRSPGVHCRMTGAVAFVVPSVTGHQMVEIAY